MPLNADNYGIIYERSIWKLIWNAFYFFNAFKIPDFEDDIVKQSD